MNRVVLTHPIIDPKQTTHNSCRDVNGLISLVLKDIIVLSSNQATLPLFPSLEKEEKVINETTSTTTSTVMEFNYSFA